MAADWLRAPAGLDGCGINYVAVVREGFLILWSGWGGFVVLGWRIG